MLVREVIEAIESKEITIQSLADKYKVSTRTIQNKIKKAGFTWNHTEGKYIPSQDVTEDILSTPFDNLMNNTAKQIKSNTGDSKQSQKHVKGDSIPRQTAKQETASTKEYDTLDYLLFGEQIKNSKRQYKGFYFDADIISIIDNVKAGNKSDLVNEALRKVFKAKGLL